LWPGFKSTFKSQIITVENTELEYSRVVTAKETEQVSDYKDREAEE